MSPAHCKEAWPNTMWNRALRDGPIISV